MQNMITYPLYDLDMSDQVPFKDQNTCYLYDLYGVVVSHFLYGLWLRQYIILLLLWHSIG